MTKAGEGRRAPPAEVWEAVRADYLSGLSGPECCRRHGVNLSGLRLRAGREGWRRRDQPWTPPSRLDPYDEGLELEEAVGGDLDRIGSGELSWVARARVMRAVLRGDAVAALRWRRVEAMLDADDEELRRWSEEEEFRVARLRAAADPEPVSAQVCADDSRDAADRTVSAHAGDGVSDAG